jgi:glycosyltransferase involved in cell wall biosynthesis
MLIGIDASRSLRAQRTGTENYSWQLIRHLLALGSGHRFRLYCHQLPPAGLFDLPGQTAGRSQLELRVIPFPRLWTHVRLSVEVTRRPPNALFVPSHVLPALHPQRSVVTVHDLGYRYFPQAHRAFDRAYLDLSTRFNARSAAHVLADSQATKGDLVRFAGVEAHKVTVVHLGRDETLAPVTDAQRLADVQQRLGIRRHGEPAAPTIVYVGTLQPRKNLVRLVDAFALARQQRPDLRLVLAGQRGWLADPIFQRVEALGLQDAVRFPGFVADADLPALLSGALCFAFPSLHEGFGFPVLEAQACGAPVLAANTSSLPEVAGDGALLVDPLDTDAIAAGLVRLAFDDDLRARLRSAGFTNLRRFSWQRCARETLTVLEAVGELPTLPKSWQLSNRWSRRS